ncbi:microaggregate-binding protein 1 [Nocardia sp. NPDC003482]|uniref:microaggregate-binding protein 1 n=1 Tax=Nocardia sp. NPDC004068 TaxID=3364303 RepID=UPI0036ACB121
MSEHEKGGIREGFEGAVEDVKGKAKEAAGTVLGNENLRDEGRTQQDRADSQQEAAKKEAEAEKERAKAEVKKQQEQAYQRGNA